MEKLNQMVSIREILALNLKEYRRKSGLTQEKLAEKAGISANYLSMVEISRQFPTPEMLDRLAQALDINTFQLFDPCSTPNGALLHLERAIVENIETVVRRVIKQDVVSEIKQTLASELKSYVQKKTKKK